jgi:riboflavin kinase/FMN adenylyltransferase
VFTFHPHPLKILAPDACPSLITTYEEKVSLLRASGIDLLLMVPFTRRFSEMPAAEFAKKILKEKLGAREIFVGFNFRFGKGREGTVERLRELGRELGFGVNEVQEVAVEGEVVSSTKIRNLIKAGNMEHAARLLGRPYAITGSVGLGDQRGRKLGFPTANVEPRQEIMPYPGVYAIRVLADGRLYDGVANAGFRPTFDKHDFCLEAHLFDFLGDLYGKEITVFFISKIRDEKRFDSLEALVEQIQEDARTARAVLAASER